MSSLHESGNRLESLGGVGAILTFPLFDLDLDDMEEDVADNIEQIGKAVAEV